MFANWLGNRRTAVEDAHWVLRCEENESGRWRQHLQCLRRQEGAAAAVSGGGSSLLQPPARDGLITTRPRLASHWWTPGHVAAARRWLAAGCGHLAPANTPQLSTLAWLCQHVINTFPTFTNFQFRQLVNIWVKHVKTYIIWLTLRHRAESSGWTGKQSTHCINHSHSLSAASESPMLGNTALVPALHVRESADGGPMLGVRQYVTTAIKMQPITTQPSVTGHSDGAGAVSPAAYNCPGLIIITRRITR